MRTRPFFALVLLAALASSAYSGTQATLIHGPGAREVADSDDAPELHGDFPQSCMVEMPTTFCSATVVSKTVAVTAAHCYTGGNGKPQDVTLYCGGNRAVYQAVLAPNPNYVAGGEMTAERIANDYTFVTLKGRKEFNAEPMPYAKTGMWGLFSNQARNTCRIAGWGYNNEGTSGRLFYAPIQFLAYEEGTTDVLTIGMNGQNVNGADPGDSGGSLICEYKSKWYLVGVLAAGKDNMAAAVNAMDGLN